MREPLVKFFIGEGGGTVPERVRQAIKHQQENSEKLIAWVQLSVVATFGALYALSPKTAAGNPWLTPVSLALLFYLLFTLLRMRLAYRYRLAGWFLDLSVILDIVLLMVLIWSFHLQYGQPASFSLKAPTLLYVFIFIALRALRFEPRYVVMCGLTAAAGWTLLVLYTVTISYPDTMITRDYVTYLTSNSVLLGAEFDKIITILVVTGIIVVALMRARRLLERAVGEAAAASDLSRFFSPEIASQIVQSEQLIRAGEGQARNAAILTVDIRDFTGLSNGMPASALITLLADYEARIVPVIERHGGTVDKFLGDGILASFGAALPSETYAADALRAADAVIGAAADWNAARAAAGEIPVRIGVAVASGRVIFGAVGADSRLEFTCIGEPVNRSAKLEKHNRAAASLAMTDAATYALACDQSYAPATAPERLAEASVAGLGGAVDLVVLAR